MTTKNKTLTTFLACGLGVLGAHRFYLKGWSDVWGWLHVAASFVGLLGFIRIFQWGQDDRMAWLLAPCLGLTLTSSCLAALVYGLSSCAAWNQRHNPSVEPEHAAGRSNGLTIFIVVIALLVGATALMSVIAFAGQRYFEYVAHPVGN